VFWNTKCWPNDQENPPEWFNDEKIEVERVVGEMQEDLSEEEKNLLRDKCILEIVRNRVLDPVIK